LINNKIELLAPAGNPESLNAAIGEGADAVYLGMKDFNARLRTKNFSYNQIEALTYKLHSMNKKVYITFNTVFEQRESVRVYQALKYLEAVGVDAVIVQDTGVIKMIRDYFPGLKIHASTQMNISTSKGVNLLSKKGVSRVVLSRECTLEDIKSIKKATNTELEVFIHGALCISYSGLCLFSSFFGGKSANRGACTQPCRRLYDSGTKDGFYFSPDDLCLADYIPFFMDIGIASLKIEGRMRSAEYVGKVVRGYRYLIDNYETEKEEAVYKAKDILQNDFARKKTIFYINGSTLPDFLSPEKTSGTGLYLGKIEDIKNIDNRIYAGAKKFSSLTIEDSVRIHSSDDSVRKGIKILELMDIGDKTYFNITEDFAEGDTVYLIQSKVETTRYLHVIPKQLDSYKKHPMRIMPPETKPVKADKLPYPSGIYVKTDVVTDLYIIQSVRPERVIIHLTRSNGAEIIAKRKTLPFKPEEIIIYTDPFISESEIETMTELLNQLASYGFREFIANNLSVLQILRSIDGVSIIAGPYLYTFNEYSAAFLNESGVSSIISPFEISKKTLFDMTEKIDPKLFFTTVFSFPQLFQINTELNNHYNFDRFTDKNGGQFIMKNHDKNKTTIVSETPFSIIDKIGQLRSKGIRRFIVDIAYTTLKKQSYKDLMEIVKKNGIFEGATRFNWKEGFYTESLHSPNKDTSD